MQAQWKAILVRVTIWLAIEILLNFLGLDTLADYGEFVFNKQTTTVNLQVLTLSLKV
jgi:preprotein translocase subunit SecG